MALVLIEKTTGELLVSMDWTTDYPTLKTRVQQILAGSGGIILPLEQGHRLILLTKELEPSREAEARERLERLLPHANRLAEQSVEKPKNSPFVKLEEVSSFETWFKDLKMEDPELNKVISNPFDFAFWEMMVFVAVVVIAAALVRGAAELVPHPVVAMILNLIKLPFLGVAVAMCLVVPLWGGYFRQPALMGLIQALCYFCFCTLGAPTWLGTLPTDILASLILGFMGYLTGMLGLVTHEKIFTAVLVHVFCIIVMLVTVIFIGSLHVEISF